MAGIIKDIDADGIFLDTMKSASEFRKKLDSVKPKIVLEGELALPVTDIASHHLSWARHLKDSQAPGILRNKWFEPRHIQHGIFRWNAEHILELHTAWMNGSGVMIWENIFGQWNGWNNRDKSILKSGSFFKAKGSVCYFDGGALPVNFFAKKLLMYPRLDRCATIGFRCTIDWED